METLPIEGIYSAIENPLAWGTFLQELCRSTGADAANLRFVSDGDGPNRVLGAAGIAEATQKAYDDEFHYIDVWKYEAERALPGEAFYLSERLPLVHLVQTEFYRRFLAPGPGWTEAFSAVIGQERRGGRAVLCLFFGMPPADRASVPSRIERLLPHIERALDLSGRLESLDLTGQMVAAFHALPTAVAIVTLDGLVRFANAAAMRHSGRGLGITIETTIGASHPVQDSLLRQMLAAAGLREQILRLPWPGGAFTILATPLPPWRPARTLLLQIAASDDPPTPPSEHLMAVLGLSPAEAEIAVAIVNGARPEETAARRGVRVSTVRSQLKSLLAKAGTPRQADLVRTAATTPRSFAPHRRG